MGRGLRRQRRQASSGGNSQLLSPHTGPQGIEPRAALLTLGATAALAALPTKTPLAGDSEPTALASPRRASAVVTHTRPREKQSPTGTGCRSWSLQQSLQPLSLPLQLLLESLQPSSWIRWTAISMKLFIAALHLSTAPFFRPKRFSTKLRTSFSEFWPHNR